MNLARELDYFGHTHDFVPLGSPNLYLKPFQDVLSLLNERETTYATYVQELASAKKANDQRVVAKQQADADIATLNGAFNVLKTTLMGLIQTRIPKADNAIKDAKTTLQTALSSLATALKYATQTILSSVSSIWLLSVTLTLKKGVETG
jgi:hypothetical protein